MTEQREEFLRRLRQIFSSNDLIFRKRKNASFNFEIFKEENNDRRIYVDIHGIDASNRLFVVANDCYSFEGENFTFTSGSSSEMDFSNLVSLISRYFGIEPSKGYCGSISDSYMNKIQFSKPPKEPFPQFYKMLKDELTIEQAELENMVLGRPFGYGFEFWNMLKKKVVPGDILKRFSGCLCEKPHRDACLSFRAGIALIRNGKIVDLYISLVS